MNAQRESLNGKTQQGSVGDVLYDITTLLELQTKLLAADARQATRVAAISVGAILIALCLLLGAIPVLLYAFADWLATATELSLLETLLISSGGSVVLAAIFGMAGVSGIRHGIRLFLRSREELSRNIESIKQSFKRNRTSQF